MIDNRNAAFSKTNRAYDDGLRKYFLRIYQLMCGALAVTAISAFAVFSIPAWYSPIDFAIACERILNKRVKEHISIHLGAKISFRC